MVSSRTSTILSQVKPFDELAVKPQFTSDSDCSSARITLGSSGSLISSHPDFKSEL